jgi:hypothetical protein
LNAGPGSMTVHRLSAQTRRLHPLGLAAVLGAASLGLAGCVATAPVTPASGTPGAVSSGSGTTPPVAGVFARLPKVLTMPADAPTARFLVRSAVPTNQQAALVQLADHDNCKLPHLAAMAARAGDPPTAAALPAGKPITLDFLVSDGTRLVCGTRWGFTPMAGKQYLVQGTTLAGLCGATLTDVTQADRPRTPDDLRYRTDTGKPCVPMDQARRVPPSMLEGGQVDGEPVLRPTATEEPLKGLIKR